MVQESKAVIRVRLLNRRGLSLTPSANEIKNILNVRAVVVGSVMWYFAAISGIPGAIIELARGDTKVYEETFGKN